MMDAEQATQAIQALVRQNQELTALVQSATASADARVARLEERATAAEVAAAAKTKSTPLVDTRAFGRPATFGGDRNEWRQWSFSFTAFLAAASDEAGPALEWAATQQTAFLMDDVEIQEPRWVEVSRQLYLALSLQCKGDPAAMIQNTPGQNGLDAWRKLCQFYEPVTRARRRQKLSQLLQPTPAKTLDETMRVIEAWETEVTRYEAKFAQNIDTEVRIAALVTLAPAKLQEHIFLNADRYDSYKETRQLIQEYAETYMASENSVHRNGPVPMDVSSL